MNLSALEQQLLELPLYAYFYVDPKSIEFSPRIRYICQTECPMYGKSWACPPGVGEVDACKAKCQSYENCLVIGTITEVQDIANLPETLSTRQEHEALTRRHGISQKIALSRKTIVDNEHVSHEGAAFSGFHIVGTADGYNVDPGYPLCGIYFVRHFSILLSPLFGL